MLGGPHVEFSGGGTGGGGGGTGPPFGWKSGAIYGPWPNTQPPNVVTPGILRLIAWYLPAAMPITEIQLATSSATLWPTTTTHQLHVAWYSDTGHWSPDKLVTPISTVVLKRRSSGVGYQQFTVTYTVPAGLVWQCLLQSGPVSTVIAFNAMNPASFKGVWSPSFLQPRGSPVNLTPTGNYLGLLSTASTFTAIPTPAPAAATLTPVTGPNGNLPAAWVYIK